MGQRPERSADVNTPMTTVKCTLCGREISAIYAREVFTGRMKYICPECYKQGQGQVTGKIKDWRNTPRGKAAMEHAKKNK